MPHLDAITIHSRRPSELARFWSELLDLPIDPSDARAIDQGTLGEAEAVLLGRRDALHVWVSPAEELAPPAAASTSTWSLTAPPIWIGSPR